jgi:hypothetical protein
MGCLPIRKSTEINFVQDISGYSQSLYYNHQDNLLFTIREEISEMERSENPYDFNPKLNQNKKNL